MQRAPEPTWPERLSKCRYMWKDENGRRLVHYEFPGQKEEMMEEYNLSNLLLVARRYRKQGAIGDWGSWVHEVGETVRKPSEHLLESAANPICVRLDDREFFIWRIRNLPYPRDVYQLSVDAAKNQIVVKTTNHKYYKVLEIPDMTRMRLKLDSTKLSFSHSNNTLVIKYKKPKDILELEKIIRFQVQKLPEKDKESEKHFMDSFTKMMADMMKIPSEAATK